MKSFKTLSEALGPKGPNHDAHDEAARWHFRQQENTHKLKFPMTHMLHQHAQYAHESARFFHSEFGHEFNLHDSTTKKALDASKAVGGSTGSVLPPHILGKFK